MAYGHYSTSFASVEAAREFLDRCRSSDNQTAENYQDRVNANRKILLAEGWSPPPLAPVKFNPPKRKLL